MNDLLLIDKENIWHPFTSFSSSSQPVMIESAQGIYLNTADGRKIIDAISSWWVNLHGHSHPHIAKAVAAQAAELEHVIFAGFTHKPAIQLAKNIVSITPDGLSKLFFSDNGSTAVEVALKMSIQYWHNKHVKKQKVIALEGAYHGDTFGAMSAGSRSIFSHPFTPYLFDVEFLEFPTSNNHEKIIAQFKKHLQTNEVGVFIYEPLLQGASGMRMYSAELLTMLIQLSKEHGVITIADEVFTGFGRTGKLFASDHLPIKPDIMTLSKGLTGGTLPLGITAVSTKIAEEFNTDDLYKSFLHGHSFTGNPIACAAANASFELLMSDDCQQSINRISNQQSAFIKKIKIYSSVLEARSLGTILAIELKSKESSSYTNDLRNKIYSYFLDHNILLRPLGNIFYMVPPYCITESELNHVHSIITEFLSTLE
jgi:adenosylmethionine-8-amino-7-oxononanoate aminotransferase